MDTRSLKEGVRLAPLVDRVALKSTAARNLFLPRKTPSLPVPYTDLLFASLLTTFPSPRFLTSRKFSCNALVIFIVPLTFLWRCVRDRRYSVATSRSMQRSFFRGCQFASLRRWSFCDTDVILIINSQYIFIGRKL